MARPKANSKASSGHHGGSHHGASRGTSVDELLPPPSPPVTRQKAASTIVQEPKKSKRQQRKTKKEAEAENDHDDSSSSSSSGDHVAATTKAAASTARAKASRAVKGVKREYDEKAREVKQVVDEISSTLSASSPSSAAALSFVARLPLPGALAPSVNTKRALRAVVATAVASTVLSGAGRVLIDWLATTPLHPWDTWKAYGKTVATPGITSFLVAVAVRIFKHAIAWRSISNLVALDVLSYGPIVYLLSFFYDVSLPATVLFEGINLAADVASLSAWRWLRGEHEDDYAAETRRGKKTTAKARQTVANQMATLYDDPRTFFWSSAFSAVLYAFTFVQACRFFLPATLVVHFSGIHTVEPARTQPLFIKSSAASLRDAFWAVVLSVPALGLSAVCGVAAHTFVFGGRPSTGASRGVSAATAYNKTVAVRTAVLSLFVGVSIFARCFFGIRGVDVVGAAVFASIFAVAPLLVGAGLGFAGV
ncbi:hypothetical protein SPI_06616 [Niveomyces insectorum RCEF 264]|uniref:Transmembrane protein n=1 Tax=Niveomyces insectorum RCEF 264 TaxID=1081102 RepID=A0A167RFK7_9HYPO|nr:hypothetical protein SPI_06616 [Niveomyces insectorum RCEF 264]